MTDETTRPQPNEHWKKAVDEGLARMEAGLDELARLEHTAVDQARVFWADMARVQQESLTWSSTLAAEWRRMSLEAFKKTAALFSARA